MATIGYVVGWLLLHFYTHYKGRAIVTYLRENYPDRWEEQGKPQPHYAVPNQNWSLFLSEKEYVMFYDDKLTKMCEKQCRLRKLVLISGIAFMFLVGGIAFFTAS